MAVHHRSSSLRVPGRRPPTSRDPRSSPSRWRENSPRACKAACRDAREPTLPATRASPPGPRRGGGVRRDFCVRRAGRKRRHHAAGFAELVVRTGELLVDADSLVPLPLRASLGRPGSARQPCRKVPPGGDKYDFWPLAMSRCRLTVHGTPRSVPPTGRASRGRGLRPRDPGRNPVLGPRLSGEPIAVFQFLERGVGQCRVHSAAPALQVRILWIRGRVFRSGWPARNPGRGAGSR